MKRHFYFETFHSRLNFAVFLALIFFVGIDSVTSQNTGSPEDDKDAAPLKTHFVSRTELKAEVFLGADDLGNLFYLENQVLYRKSGNRMFSFSNVDLGEISQVDVSNPFKILLLYRDFNSVIILDNNLNELSSRLDFTRETQFNNVRFVSNSSQNNIWLYADDNKLHLYNYQLLAEQVQTQAVTFYQEDFEPIALVSTFKNVWILSSGQALQFNEYGNLLQTYDLPEATRQIFPFRKGIVSFGAGIFRYHGPEKNQKIDLDHTEQISGPVQNISLSGTSVFLYDGETVFRYDILPEI